MNILIIDDEANIRKTLSMSVETMGHQADLAGDEEVAKEFLKDERYDAVLLDLRLGDTDGLVLLDHIIEKSPETPVVVFTAHASVDTAVDAMRRGARDYLAKPFTPEQIQQVLGRLAMTNQLEQRVAILQDSLASSSPEVDLTTEEPEMQKVYDIAMRVANSQANMLILGESGTGKSVLARSIHENSPLRDKPCVTVNCPCLTRELLQSELFGHVKGAFTGAMRDTWGKVAAADGGTLFLDEIGELPLEVQPKLLRLLQEREYERVGETKTRKANVRLIAATNRDLQQRVEEGAFREDLYYRLNVISVNMMPLRQRPSDLVRMAHHYLKFFSDNSGKRMKGFSKPALQAMQTYAWPGNLRELRNVIERAVILGDGQHIELSDFPEQMRQETTEAPLEVGSCISLEELEKQHIKRLIERTETLEEAAQILGIDPATLYRKRRKWDKEAPAAA